MNDDICGECHEDPRGCDCPAYEDSSQRLPVDPYDIETDADGFELTDGIWFTSMNREEA